MLKRFECRNFKGFNDTLIFDFTCSNYNFNKEIIKNGLVNKALVYGKNGSGKSNLGIAIFDIVSHLTDKQRMPFQYIANYLCLSSLEDKAIFKYVFAFGSDEIIYEYAKTTYDNLIYEKIEFNKEVILDYHYFDSTRQFIDESIKKNLNIYLIDNKISVIKYIYRNTISDEDSPITKIVQFVEGMLWYRSLSDGNNYAGFTNGATSLDEALYLSGQIKNFEDFLRKQEIFYKLDFGQTINGHQLLIDFENGKKAPFSSVVSTGTQTLYLFFYWKQYMTKLTFLFIDEFDAFLHFEAAESLIKFLNTLYNCQTVLTTHNTYLMCNKITRPDCCYIISNNAIKQLADCTEKDIREGHNLEKMYINGAFNE